MPEINDKIVTAIDGEVSMTLARFARTAFEHGYTVAFLHRLFVNAARVTRRIEVADAHGARHAG